MLNKKILGVVAVALSTIAISAQATTDGIYFGGQLGYGNVHQNIKTSNAYVGTLPTSIFASTSNKDTGLAGRLSGGYQFNQHLAAELGWTRFSNATGKGVANVFPVFIANESSTIKTNAIDLVAKGILPVGNNFSVYGKLGAAYVIQTVETKGTVTHFAGLPGLTPVVSFNTNVKSSTTNKSLLPTAGAGVSYAFNDKLSADLEYNRIQKVGSSKVNSTDFVGLGLTYSIG